MEIRFDHPNCYLHVFLLFMAFLVWIISGVVIYVLKKYFIDCFRDDKNTMHLDLYNPK